MNNNNQFNQMNPNNNILGILDNNQNLINNLNNLNILNNNNNTGFNFNNNMNNFNMPLPNNNIYFQNPQKKLIFQLALTFINNKGWTLYNQDGNVINTFTTFDLYKFLTEKIIVDSIKLDNFIIGNTLNDTRFKGGDLFLYLTDNLENVFNYLENQYKIKQMEMKQMFATNNNFNMNLNNLNNNINVNNNKYMNQLNNNSI